jgi:hypothetical protein
MFGHFCAGHLPGHDPHKERIFICKILKQYANKMREALMKSDADLESLYKESRTVEEQRKKLSTIQEHH